MRNDPKEDTPLSRKYQALLQPINIRGTILRNRMLSSASTPHFLQGVENWPTEKIITHFANRAKSGAAAVSINHFHNNSMPFPGRKIEFPPIHFNLFDINDRSCHNYLCQLVDAIHFYGAKATGYLMADPGWFNAGGKMAPMAIPDEDNMPPFMVGPQEPACTENDYPGKGEEMGPSGMDVSAISREMIANYVKNVAQEAKDLKDLGFDIISMHCCYRHSPHALFLSPLTNHRTDIYGGSLENRSRFVLEIFRAIREAVGNSIPLEIVYSVCEPEGGYTVEDTIGFASLADGLIDILHLRSGDLDPQHPVGYTSTEANPAPFLDSIGQVTKGVRANGLKMIVAASAGFQNIEHANQAVADGKADLIAMARSWINNPNYGQLVYEGRGQDVVPCIRCNKCHVPNGTDMYRSVCSVNPRIGFEDKLERMIETPKAALKVAVIGGGPAGMEFAITAAERGHQVILYEASDKLGGLLKHSDYPSFKWPLRQYKDYLAAQMAKNSIELRLNTRATPEMLSGLGFDAIAVAIGSYPCAPCLPGLAGENVSFASQIYGKKENELTDDIVVIGGGEIGVETALYLCELGKRVTVLEMLPELIADAPHAHYKTMVQSYWRRQPNFRFKCGVVCTNVDPDGVRYIGTDGKEGKVMCTDVLIAAGARPLTDEAMTFAGIAPRFIVIGDCDGVANVQKAVRSAFAAASTL